MSFLTLDTFLILPFESYQISVIKFETKKIGATIYIIELLIYNPELNFSTEYLINRRYSEFRNLYETIMKLVPSLKLPEFPPKIQLIDKEEKRIKYFNLFLNTIYEVAKSNIKFKKDLLTELYKFLFKDTDFKRNNLTDEQLLKVFKINPNTKEKIISDNEKENNEKDNLYPPIDYSNLNVDDPSPKNKLFGAFQNMHENLRNNIKNTIENYKSDFENYLTNFTLKSNNNNNSNDNIFIKTVNKKDPNKFKNNTWEWNDILVKSSFEDYNMRTIRIHDQILFLYENSTNANFYFFMPLYNINIDVYQNIYSLKSENFNYIKHVNLINPQEILNLYEKYPNLILGEINSDFYFRLYHDFDTFEFIIKFDKNNLLAEMKTILQMIINNSYSGKTNSLYIKNINRTNLNILGSIYVEILTFYAPFLERSIKFKINLDPYKIYTKTVTSTQKFSINQRFKIPLHNRFNIFKISLFKVEEKSLYVKNEEKQKLSEYSITLPEILNVMHGNNKDIITIDLKNLKKKKKYDNMKLEIKFIDYSALDVLYSKNSNKFILENYPLYNENGDTEPPFTIAIFLKRAKKMISFFVNIFDIKDNITQFKYPNFSIFCLILAEIYFIFFKTQYLLNHILFIFGMTLFFNSKIYYTYFAKDFNYYFFSYKNKYYTTSKYVETDNIRDKNEMKQSNYLVKKKSGFKIPSIKQIKEFRQTYNLMLFTFSKVVTILENLKNLFFWTDPLLSFYCCILISALLLILYGIETRWILMFSITKKFFEGFQYYELKLINNKEVARIILQNSYQKFKKDSIGTGLKSKTLESPRLREIIKENFRVNAEVFINDEVYKYVHNIGDLIEEVGKCEELIKIKKNSELYYLTRNNDDIYIKSPEIEDIIGFFLKNIKSDYYMQKNGLIDLYDMEDFKEEEFNNSNDSNNNNNNDKNVENNNKNNNKNNKNNEKNNKNNEKNNKNNEKK